MLLKSEFLNEIKTRGFIYQASDVEELDKILMKNKITGYIGFDITSDSLHIGSLVQLQLLLLLVVGKRDLTQAILPVGWTGRKRVLRATKGAKDSKNCG